MTWPPSPYVILTASEKLTALASTGLDAFGSATEDSANLGMMVRQLEDTMTGRIDVGLEWCWANGEISGRSM